MLGNDTISIISLRILNKIDENPEILEMHDVWQLLSIKGLDFSDIQPSVAQVRHGFVRAIEFYNTRSNIKSIQ